MNPVNIKPYQIPSDAVWFVTGCSQGLGRELSEIITKNPSHRLIATARNIAALSYLADSNPNILKLQLDVSSASSVNQAFEEAAARWGRGPEKKLRLDVVINNAGYSLSGDTENATEQQVERHMQTLFNGTARVTVRAVRSMREGATDGRGGLIINISSAAGLCAFPGTAYYHAAKFAVEGFTESMAREVHPDWNINFCLIEPGMIKTNFESTSKDRIPPHPGYAAPGTPRVALSEYVAQHVTKGSGASPDLVAQTIYGVATRGAKVPLRLPLGSDCWGLARSKSAGLVDELDALKEQSFMGSNQGSF